MTYEELLNSALPGTSQELKGSVWKSGERPWKLWKSGNEQYAVFPVVGERIGKTSLDAIKEAKKKNIRSILLIPETRYLEAIADKFLEIESLIVCPIAGTGHVLDKSTFPPSQNTTPSRPPSRIPLELLELNLASSKAGQAGRSHLVKLVSRYRKLKREGKITDKSEQEALETYTKGLLKEIGFSGQEVELAKILRKIESAGYGAKRDHFFHSFQNYFFGLYAVLELRNLFCLYDTQRRIGFEVDPVYVWVLTALWHDVGYGVQKGAAALKDFYGEECALEVANQGVTTFLDSAHSKCCLNGMASLITRLTSTSAPSATWMEPQNYKRTATEKALIKAMRRNVSEHSHGVASSLRMFSDCMPRISKLTNDKQLRPKQCLWIACASAPFHDYLFRKCLREETGTCLIPTDALPFAALLAFIDSIQDDRRDIAILQDEVQFLKSLNINHSTGEVVADVDSSALSGSSAFWKIVEARDVKAALSSSGSSLKLSYPGWMAG